MTENRKETWYVISDTKAQIVNLIPALAIEIENIDRILTLRGESPLAVDRRRDALEGELTNGWLKNAFENESQSRNWKVEFERISADKDDAQLWTDEICKFFNGRHNVGRIIFVYTGGTKDMSHGAWEGLKKVKSEILRDAEIEFVAKHEHRVYYAGSSKPEIPLIDGKNLTKFDSYLALHGFMETPGRKTTRLAWEKIARDRKDITYNLRDLIFAVSNNQAIQDRLLLLNKASQGEEKNMTAEVTTVVTENGKCQCMPARYNLLQDFIRSAVKFFKDIPEVRVKDSGANIFWSDRPKDNNKYVRGGWFEEYVYLRVLALAEGANAEVMLNLQPAYESNPDTNNGNDAEIDVAFRVNDVLHLIECKTGREREQDKKSQIYKLHERKQKLTSLYGEAWFCDARPQDQPSQNDDLETSLGAIRRFAGPKEVDKMFAEMAAFIKRSPTRGA